MAVNKENIAGRENSALEQKPDWFRKYILNNLGIKIISILVAFIVWMVIINIEDPYKEKTFTVPVETINEDALVSVNKVYEVIEGGTAQVKVKGKKSVVDGLKPTDIRATADLSNLSAVNAVAIVPRLVKNVSSEPILECTQVLKVSLEDMASKQVKVSVLTEGTPDEGFSVGDCFARPNMIEVTGGQSAIDKIDSVKVTINVNGASEDFTSRVKPVAYDAEGEEVVSSTLTFGTPRIKATVHILETKTIPVKIKITGTPADGYEFVQAECLPEKIEIAGSTKNLSAINEVEIPIDITGMKSSSGAVEQNIITQDYLPEGVTVLSDYAQVSLRIEIEKQEKKTIDIPVDVIKFASLDDALKAEILESADYIQIVVQGRQKILDSFEDDGYTAFVDCEGLREGRHSLTVKLDLGDTCTLLKSEKVTVRITKRKASDEAERTPAPEVTDKATASPEATTDTDDSREEE